MSRMLPLIALAVVVGAGGAWYMSQPGPTATLIPPLLAQDAGTTEDTGTTEMDPAAMILPDIVLGDANAPVTFIEYASYTCPHCGNFHADQFKKLKAEYIDTGKVKFIHREVYFDKFGLWGGLLAQCGGEMRYYGISGMLYDQQKSWIGSGKEDEILANLRTLAIADEITACLDDKETATKLVATFQSRAQEDGINATPTLLIDGEKYPNSPYEELKELIDARLAEVDG